MLPILKNAMDAFYRHLLSIKNTVKNVIYCKTMFFLQHNATFGQKGHHLALWVKISDEC